MAIEPESAALRALIAADEEFARRHPGAFGAFLAWAADRRRRYAAERRAWRDANPLIDVASLEAAFGIEADILTVEQLRASAPPVIIKDEEGP